MARRLAAGSTHAERDAIVFERWAAAFAVALGALSGWAIRQAAESTARGGGLLSAFAYLPLLAAAYLGALAVASWIVRRGFRAAAPRDALRARDPAPAEPGDRRS